ncbi:MAG: hypothetical protein AAFX87_11395 [Bacteroidota bacterium]
MLKYILYFSLLFIQPALAQDEPPQFVVTHAGDTIEAKKLFFTQHQVVIKTPDGEKENFDTENVASFKKEYQKHGPTYFQVVKICPEPVNIYSPMIIVEEGPLTLLLEPNLDTGNTYYVTGEGFDNYVTLFRNFGKLRMLMQKCTQMQESYPEAKDYRFKDIRALIQAYNQYCK